MENRTQATQDICIYYYTWRKNYILIAAIVVAVVGIFMSPPFIELTAKYYKPAVAISSFIIGFFMFLYLKRANIEYAIYFEPKEFTLRKKALGANKKKYPSLMFTIKVPFKAEIAKVKYYYVISFLQSGNSIGPFIRHSQAVAALEKINEATIQAQKDPSAIVAIER